MSYILDALRRLEQDKELAKRGASPMEAVLVPDIEGVEEPERMRLWWVGAGVVLLLTVIALTYWVTRHTLVPPTEHAREGAAPQLSSAQPGYDPPPVPPRRRRHPHPSSPFRQTWNERLPRRAGDFLEPRRSSLASAREACGSSGSIPPDSGRSRKPARGLCRRRRARQPAGKGGHVTGGIGRRGHSGMERIGDQDQRDRIQS